jgi:phytoene dehydrogenase-like protein
MAARGGETWDVAVIGAGHNGLVAAAALAHAGARVLVLEAGDEVGGAARTHEFAPGYRVSSCAHLVHLLSPAVIRALDLVRHGLSFAAVDLATVALAPGGRPLVLPRDRTKAAAQIAAFSRTDAERWPAFDARLKRFAHALAPFLAFEPPRLSGGWRDRWMLARLAFAMRRLGKAEMRELLRIIALNAADLVEDEFETDLLKGAIAFDAVIGAKAGPRSPGTVFNLLYRAAGETQGHQGAFAIPKGGMGAIAEVIARAARAEGAEIRVGVAVARILVDAGRAVGLVTAQGEEIRARQVLSATDPKRTFRDLVGGDHLDTDFLRRVDAVRTDGIAAKVHLALDGLPTIPGLAPGLESGRMLLAPSVGFVEEAFNAAKYGAVSDMPALEITIPSTVDSSLAPAGRHVMSVLVQWTPHQLREGGWDSRRDWLGDKVLAVLGAAMPDLAARVVAREVLTPLDLERRHGLTGGHWHHGELALDNVFMWRPIPGWAQYRTPIDGLYLGGAGAHPGGGVMGLPGLVAARALMNDRVRAAAAT